MASRRSPTSALVASAYRALLRLRPTVHVYRYFGGNSPAIWGRGKQDTGKGTVTKSGGGGGGDGDTGRMCLGTWAGTAPRSGGGAQGRNRVMEDL